MWLPSEQILARNAGGGFWSKLYVAPWKRQAASESWTKKFKECTWDETTIDYRLQQPRYIRTTMHIIYKQHHQQQNHHT